MDAAATTAEQLAAIVESSDDAILSTDLESIVTTWNRGAERIYGYAAAEVIGRHVSLIIPDAQRDELRSIVSRIKAGRRIEMYETTRRAKDGRLVEVALTVSPLKDSAGQIVGASAIARDITTQKDAESALRTSEARLRSIVESAVDGIMVIDGQGRIELFSPAAERLFGYEASELIGQSMLALVPEGQRERHTQYVAAPEASGISISTGEGRAMAGRRKDGSLFPIFLSVGEMKLGQERKYTAIVRDISARVQLETQMREQESLARLGEMAAVIAHEVRNPLAAVKGAIQVIGSRLPSGNTDAPVIADIVARLDTLNELMKDILLFARPPRPNLSAVALAPLVYATCELFKDDPTFTAIQIEVTGEAPAVSADAGLLKIIFLNLLINSAQAMHGDGIIRVAIGPSPGGSVVTVIDAGPGIPEDIRDKIFTPFFTTKARGTGLGLPTAKRLVEAQGGRVSFVCPPGGGTTVTVELPTSKIEDRKPKM